MPGSQKCRKTRSNAWHMPEWPVHHGGMYRHWHLQCFVTSRCLGTSNTLPLSQHRARCPHSTPVVFTDIGAIWIPRCVRVDQVRVACSKTSPKWAWGLRITLGGDATSGRNSKNTRKPLYFISSIHFVLKGTTAQGCDLYETRVFANRGWFVSKMNIPNLNKHHTLDSKTCSQYILADHIGI